MTRKSLLSSVPSDDRRRRVTTRSSAGVGRGVGLAAVLLLGSAVRSADAQVAIEAGAYVGRACITGEPVACENNPPLFGLHAGVWFNDRMELRARYVELRRDDRVDTFGTVVMRRYDSGFSLLRAEFIRYFGREHGLRPFVGASVGLRRLRLPAVRCEPVSCTEAGFPLSSSQRGIVQPDVGVTAGLSFEPIDRLRVQGLIGQQHSGTVEAGVLVGVSLWRSR